MKNKNLSVVSLFLRSSVYKVLTIVLLMITISSVVSFINFKSADSIEILAEISYLKWIFMASGLLITACILLNFREITESCKSQLFLVTPREVFFDEVIAGMLLFLIWYLAEVLFAIVLAFSFAGLKEPQFITSQTVFLSFYRSEFLHFLLPFEDISCIIKNILIIVSLGFSSAFFPGRKNQMEPLQIAAPVFVAIGTVHPFGNEWNYISSVILAFLILWHFVRGTEKSFLAGGGVENEA